MNTSIESTGPQLAGCDNPVPPLIVEHSQHRGRRKCGWHTSPSNRHGTVTVEMAFVLPVVLAFLVASLDLSRANMIRNTMANAAVEGARTASLPGATAAEAIAAANERLNVLGVVGANVSVTPANLNTPSEQITVSVSVAMANNLYASSSFLTGKTLTRSCSLTREQPTAAAP